MKRVQIIILVLFIILSMAGLVVSQEIELDFPESVNSWEEFEVDLNLINFSADIYDIKIDIFGEGTRLSKIWEGDSWQSTYNYVDDIIDFPNEEGKTFRLNITENFEGVADIEVKTRNSAGSIKVFEGYQININSADVDENVETYFELDWDEDDVVNGETFKIEINAFNLEDDAYDLRLWIEEGGDIISDRYDEDTEEWKSGSYYLDEFFKDDSGNESKKVKLRIKEQHDNFDGIANLILKIRGGNTTQTDIEILEPEENNPSVIASTQKASSESKDKTDEIKEDSSPENEIIRLGKIDKQTDEIEENKIVYESKNEIIKKYSILGFAVLCVALVVLFAWRKLN